MRIVVSLQPESMQTSAPQQTQARITGVAEHLQFFAMHDTTATGL